MKYCTVCKEKFDDGTSFCPVDGEVLEGDPAAIVNTVLDGQYQMEALLGKGGMGAVYRARHILLGDRVAIKVLPPEVRTNAEWLRRFRREGQAARRFRHPNSVTVYDLRTSADGTIYMVMEYVEGHTLDAELKKRGRLSAAESLEILTPIMSVLDTAHSMGVVHRDLKPENIMMGKATGNEGPVVKLLDLGIAKMREIAGVDTGGNTALTMAGQVLGTPYYMSPEQWGEIPRDENEEIDGRADIYSLGLVFYEMIAGRRCFAGTTLHELRREHVSTPAKPLAEVVPTVPQGFSDAIQRATAKDRSDRQPTASVLLSELKAGLGTAAPGGKGAVSAINDFTATITTSENLQTNSDGTAATILTLDPAATSAPDQSPSTTTPPAVVDAPRSTPPITAQPDPAVSGATVVERADMASSATIQQPRPVPVQPSPPVPPIDTSKPASKSMAGLAIGAVVLVVVLGVVVVGGYFVYKSLKPAGSENTNQNTVVTPTGPTQVAQYWLELEPSQAGTKPTQIAGLVPIASGQSFKMHFVFTEGGFLYVIGPAGDNNQPAAFLTTKPASVSGLTTNQVPANSTFIFPGGDGLLTLDKRPGTDTFTIIYSKTKLETPSFLNDQVTGDPMTSNQLSEFRDFVSKYMKTSPTTELDDSNNQAPFVRVKVNADKLSGPIVFEIRIQHN